MDVLQRFLSHVEVDPNSGCWLWGAYCEPAGGYGRFNWDRYSWLAHRASWTLHNGPIPTGLDVLHRCDTPPCVRPDHLFLGDDFMNQQDRRAKGRHNNPDQRGEDNPGAKLTEATVLEIRALCLARGASQAAIASKFAVSQPLVSLIHNRKIWAHV